MRTLAKETAIYGMSSIVGKFLNWLLVPLYTFVLEQSSDYGIVTNLYAWTALLLVILTYGMETGFFRFANKEGADVPRVYGTTMFSVGSTSLVFAVCCVLFAQPLANVLGYPAHAEFIAMLGVVVSLDAFGCIPFAYLRYKRRPIKFAALKLFMILVNILLNIFFLVVCPWLMQKAPQTVDWFYDPSYGVGYVFVANLFSTGLVTLALLSDILEATFKPDFRLLKKILAYSLPLLVMGIAGIMNQTVDKIIFPFLFADKEYAAGQLGIYGACFKISMVMMMFTQAFRYAYEPFIFAQHQDKNSPAAYAAAMKYFVIFSFLILLGMIFYLDIFKLIIRSDYWSGLRVVPVVLFAYIFQGVFFNLSLWYKLTDKTQYGAYFSLLGCVITIIVNVLFVPRYSYMASAWASFVCYFVMMLASYFIGQKYMKIPYDLKSLALYTVVALLLLTLHYYVVTPYTWLNYVLSTVFLFAYLLLVVKRDFPLRNLPVIGKYFK